MFSRWMSSSSTLVSCARLLRSRLLGNQGRRRHTAAERFWDRGEGEVGAVGSRGWCRGALSRGFSSKASSESTASSSSSRIPPQAVSYGSLAVLMATGGGIVAYYKYAREEQIKGVRNLPASGKAAVGGAWTLIGPDGKPFESKALEGEFSLLYFGFCFCPDICPAELEKIAQAVDIVEKITKRKIRPTFITIDPERDDTETVNDYCLEFHPRLLGLTGTKDQIQKITRLFRVYFSKTSDSEDDYLIDHSIISYLVDPEGNFVKFFGKNSSANDMAMEIKRFVDEWKATHKKYNS